jgi:hypothetical protein
LPPSNLPATNPVFVVNPTIHTDGAVHTYYLRRMKTGVLRALRLKLRAPLFTVSP